MKKALWSKTYSLLAALAISHFCYSQSVSFSKNTLDFQIYIERSFNEQQHPPALDTLCRIGCAFVKFSIDERGQVTDLICNPNTPAPLAAYLNQLIQSTSGQWIPAKLNGASVAGGTMILPVMYVLEYNCRPADQSFGDILSMLQFEKPVKDKVPTIFDSIGRQPLSCTILPGVMLQSPRNCWQQRNIVKPGN